MIAEHEKRIHFLDLSFKICIGVREHFLYPKSKVFNAIAWLQKTFRHQSLTGDGLNDYALIIYFSLFL